MDTPIVPDTEEIKQRRLTIKQRRWLKKYIECGNATEAAMQVYDCQDRFSARVIGSENLTKLNYAELMEDFGLTDLKLLKKTDEGLDANRVISAMNTDKQANGGTSDFIEVPDYAIRHRYLETALKLKKRINEKSVGIEVKDGDKTMRVIVKDFI